MGDHPPVVIIGAGVGGLSLALLLRQQGVQAEVLERAGQLREVGAAIAVAANGTRVLQRLGLAAGLARAGTEPTRLVHRDGRDGRAISVTPGPDWYRAAFGAPFYGLHRRARQVQLASWAASAALHLPAGPSTQARDAYLAQVPDRLAWIHGYDALAAPRLG